MNHLIKLVLILLIVVGSYSYEVHGSDQKISSIEEVLSLLKAELIRMENAYPEMARVNKIRSSDFEVHYRHHCRFLGKRGYEDTGPDAVAVGLRFMPVTKFQVEVKRVAMQIPMHRWASLSIVGWQTLYVGKNPSPGLRERLSDLLNRHIEMINELDRLSGKLHRELKQKQ